MSTMACVALIGLSCRMEGVWRHTSDSRLNKSSLSADLKPEHGKPWPAGRLYTQCAIKRNPRGYLYGVGGGINYLYTRAYIRSKFYTRVSNGSEYGQSS